MSRQYLVVATVCVLVTGTASAQGPVKIDFVRDVQPLFNTHCIECHGPKPQKNGLQLDRRRAAFRGGSVRAIAPGTSEASRLYLKLIGDRYGPQMPPEGTLSREEIEVIKSWIDQGAEWPDDAAGEAPVAPPDPKATRMMALLRDGDRGAFRKMLRDEPKAANRKGPGGSTPLMYAVLYGDAES